MCRLSLNLRIWSKLFCGNYFECVKLCFLLLLTLTSSPHLPHALPTPQSVNGISSHDEEEINELQEDDRELFSDQLSSIGMLGRVAADHCIPLLTR